MSDYLESTRELEFRGIDEEKRQARFVATTEAPVDTWDGPEVLRMKGADLKRYKKNPILLDSHNRSSIDSIIGRVDVEVVGRALHATATYAETPRAENVWQLVKGGFARAMSIGYRINREHVKRINKGETDGDGDGLVNGPAVIARKWELLEVSNVPVPADPGALARTRAFYDSIPNNHSEEANMADKNADTTTGAKSAISFPAPAPAAPVAPSVTAPAQVAAVAQEQRSSVEATARDIRAITPRGLEGLGDTLIAEGKTLDEARAALLAAQRERYKPVGTPEAKPAERAPEAPQLSDADLVNGLRSL